MVTKMEHKVATPVRCGWHCLFGCFRLCPLEMPGSHNEGASSDGGVIMTTTAPIRTPPDVTRRAGYVVGAVVNGMLLLAVNVWPGWQVVPFLTAQTSQVLGLVNPPGGN